ncbi:zonular occludens toxin domain-containing protein [Vogesella mureinivorans]|uniref:zonular occludens toxin domain-containing protein n=1 Tax=Vogesella mureinivorans TaxID=657276 RepID=UPI0011CB1079|nr:zonular occludens toxin domain-containing protein [Vogesella mureinivorans]
MAINAYVGLQGSGKSYEVVSSVIIDAVSHGRRVVTNVDGIDEDRIHEYLVNTRDADPEKLGAIVHVGNDRIMQPAFFPDEEKPETESVVKGGDLVAIDEAWRFWGTDNGKLSHEHMQFFRMHRHYVHEETRVACDVVLMTQDITGLHRSVKNVVEFVFRMHKLKSLGLNRRYRVDIHEGWKLNSKTRIDQRQKAYDPKIFPLYQSYAGGAGQENQIDKRQNILAKRTLWVYVGLTVVVAMVSSFGIWRFFHRGESAGAGKPDVPKTVTEQGRAASAPSVARPGETPPVSQGWRIAGSYMLGSERWVVIADAQGRLRVESPSVFHSMGIASIGEIDGERVAYWSGAAEGSPSVPMGVGK